MITLFDLPLEILQGILSDSILSPRDLFHFSLANQTLFQFVNDNNLPLDKSTYLNLFDYNPNSQLGIPNQGYKQTLLDILQAKHCMSLGHSLSINNSVTWLQLAATPLPLNTNTDADTLSKNSAFLSTALKYFNAVTFKKDRSNPDPVQNLISLQHAQHTSHLLTLKTADISLSVPSTTVEFSFDSNGTQLSKNSYRTTQPASEHARRQVESDYRRTVYSSKNFNSRSLFGPFMPMPGFASVEQDIQGRMNLKVDWIKVEALAYLMVKNLSALIPEWAAYTGEGPFFPTGWDSTRPRQIPLDAGRDWAGVEEFGWIGTYSFLDFRVWDFFNRSNQSSRLTLAEDVEAVGDAMLLKLTLLPSDAIVDPLEPADRQRRVAPLDATSSYPPLHFVGEISSVIQMRGAPERAVKGTVQLTKEGDVWWKFVISYDGESQWILNGIQVGGIRSRYGIVGAWSAVGHENGSPNGPFWYWPQVSA